MSAATDFRINISAVDKASATIKKITEAFNRLGKATSLDKIGEQLGGAAEKLGAFGGPGGAIGSIGTLGGLAAYARQWADVGNQVSLASYKIGIGTGQLTKLQAAARLTGVGEDVATSAVAAAAKNIGNALSGADGGTMAGYFAQLGITPKIGPDGRANIMDFLRGVQRELAKAPSVAGKNRILEKLGLPEDARPLIENLDELVGRIERVQPNAQTAIDAGNELDKTLRDMGESARGSGQDIATILLPGVNKLATGLRDLMHSANEASHSGPLAHLKAIAAGAGGGALAGAAGGALIGGAAGLTAGGVGVVPGVIGGAITGAIRGGATGAAAAAGLDLIGHSEAPQPQYDGSAGDVSPGIASMFNPGVRNAGAASGIKRHNPGNLRRRDGTGFQEFDSDDAGLAAAARNLVAYERKHGLRTISGIIGRWAPPTENDTSGYIRDVESQTGIGATSPIDGSASTNAAILAAIVKREQGRQPFTPEQLTTAVTEAMKESGTQGGEVHVTVNAPPGSTATAQTNNEKYWPVRVRYAMPTGAVNP